MNRSNGKTAIRSLKGTVFSGLVMVFLAGCYSPSTPKIRSIYAEPDVCVPQMYLFPDVKNFRDLGGWRTEDGKIVRKHMIFRSGRFNETWKWYKLECTRDNLSDKTKRFLVKDLGIKTEIDLRKVHDCRQMTGSPLGQGVKFVNIQAKAYGDLATPEGKDAFRQVFRVFLEQDNYPIVFHCVEGKDRAGSVAFILNGLLGVPLDDLVKDWQASALWSGSRRLPYEQKLSRLVKVFDAYEGDTLKNRIEEYVLELGFTRDDVAKFRKMMLVDSQPPKR